MTQEDRSHVSTQPLLNRVSRTKLKLSYSLLSLGLVVDQLLLPMFRVSSVPYKVSYFILGFWLIHWSASSQKSFDATRDIYRVFSVVGIILSCILLGELWLSVLHTVPTYLDTVRVILTFGFAAMAFGLGRTSTRFDMACLVPIFFVAITLNVMFIVFKNDLPVWFINFYYPVEATSDDLGFQSVEDIIALTRPRGLFGNPNISMLMINIIVLFIHLGLRNQVLKIKSATTAMAIVILPVLLSAALASRGEFLVALTLGFLNYRLFYLGLGRLTRKRLNVLIILFVLMLSVIVERSSNESEFVGNIERIAKIAEVLSKSDDIQQSASTFERPLITFQLFSNRFIYSPLFGSGVSPADGIYFEDGTQYFHNDWFFMLTVAGLIGTLSLVWLIRLFVRRLGWPAFIPLVLPGVVNSFMLTIPALIVFFALVGVCMAEIEKTNIKQSGLRS